MLVRALLRSGALAPNDVWAANRSAEKLDALAAAFPGIHISSSREVAAHCGLIFLCLSASDTASVLAEVDAEFSPAQLLLTTAAAIPLKMLEDRVPCRASKLIPSIAQEIGAGITLLITDRELRQKMARQDAYLSHRAKAIGAGERLAGALSRPGETPHRRKTRCPQQRNQQPSRRSRQSAKSLTTCRSLQAQRGGRRSRRGDLVLYEAAWCTRAEAAGTPSYFDCRPVTLQVLDVSSKSHPHPAAKSLYFTVKNLKAVFDRAQALNCLSREEVHDAPGGGIVVRPWGERSFYAEDPWGNLLCLVEEGTVYTG